MIKLTLLATALFAIFFLYSYWRAEKLKVEAIEVAEATSRCMKPWNESCFVSQLSKSALQRATINEYSDFIKKTNNEIGNLKSINSTKCKLDRIPSTLLAYCWSDVIFEKHKGQINFELSKERNSDWKVNILTFEMNTP